MARSQYIYVVTEVHDYGVGYGSEVLATFTVKHECATWLKKNPTTTDTVRELHRHSGCGSARTEMNIEELLKE